MISFFLSFIYICFIFFVYIYICLFIYIFVYIYICLFCDLVVIHQCVVQPTSAGNFRAFFFSFLSFFLFVFFFLQSTANLTAPWSEKILGMISFFFSFFIYQGQIYGPGCDLSWSAESSKGQRYRNPYFKSENLSMYFPTYNMDFYIFVLLNSQHFMIDHILGHKSSLGK